MNNSPLWHPCTQMQQHEHSPPLHIQRAKGAYLYVNDNQPLLDAISSWWVNLHGHSHPYINQAISDQLQQFEHVILAGFSHRPIEQLAERLVALTPAALTRCFFADSGSAAVEVALKMSLQYWHQQGQPKRTTFISLENGYHGETLGSLAVTDIPLFSSQYRPLLINHLRAPSPDLSLKPAAQLEADYLEQRISAMENLLVAHPQQVCAIIVEPLVQGAAGMKMYPAHYLKELRSLCNRYHVHLILDEIAVGFGRTGTLFAHEQAGICPDFLCLSKGLTAGYLPMSCVMTTDEVYRAFYSPDVARGFLHSHSFTGNPLAARAALASLELFEQDNILEKNRHTSAYMTEKLQALKQHAHIRHVRQTGMIAAFDLAEQDGSPYPSEQQRGKLLAKHAIEHGVLLRPIGNHVYFIPPYCVSTQDIDLMFDVAIQALDWSIRQPRVNALTEQQLP